MGALSQIYDIPIVWKHFGDGESEKKLKELCEKLLSGHDNIKWQFMGRVTNREMLEYYAKEKPHVLINVNKCWRSGGNHYRQEKRLFTQCQC